ncbi:MAG TPA: flagellar hook-length control protein FliK [Verrucomicrobiae bacterium]|nr:flagellar hook-length control protein FliK [Verrucomicrobiae bacterium]
MAQLNFPETKIDAPVLGMKQTRRESELPADDGGEEFDRLVAKAAEKGNARSDSAKSGHRTESGEDAAANESCAAEDASPGSDAATAGQPVAEASVAPSEANQDPALQAVLVAVLLPVADSAIKLPAMDAASFAGADKAPAVIAANGKIKLPQPTELAGDDAPATPVPNTDIAALIAALPQATQPDSDKHITTGISALPQAAPVAAKTQTQVRLEPAAAPASAPPATALEGNAAGPSLRPEIAGKGVSAARSPESAVKQANDDQASLETMLPPAELEIQPTGLSLARHFVREVATQYQATAVAGSAARSAEDASAANQVSIRLIHSLHEGRKAVQILLNPSELGSIDVSMQWQGDRLTAHFVVDRPETLDLLQRDIKILEQSLGDSGFSSDNGGLSFSLRQQMENQGERRSSNGTPSTDPQQNADPETPLDEPSAVRDGVLVLRV